MGLKVVDENYIKNQEEEKKKKRIIIDDFSAQAKISLILMMIFLNMDKKSTILNTICIIIGMANFAYFCVVNFINAKRKLIRLFQANIAIICVSLVVVAFIWLKELWAVLAGVMLSVALVSFYLSIKN